MIQTSNFAKSGTRPNAVSIATGSPDWFKGETKECLFPGWKLVKGHKSKQISDSQYVTEYVKQLNCIDVHAIAKELDGKILLCWCKSDTFCHRHIVRKWLQHHGYECEEI